jgi:hypothetical protein
MTNETIQLLLIGDVYHIKTNSPKTFELFGADTLPTPFTTKTPLAVVLERIKTLNPKAHVFA